MATQGGRSMTPRDLVCGAHCFSDGRIAPIQRYLQPRPQPEEDKNKRLGGLGRLLGTLRGGSTLNRGPSRMDLSRPTPTDSGNECGRRCERAGFQPV